MDIDDDSSTSGNEESGGEEEVVLPDVNPFEYLNEKLQDLLAIFAGLLAAEEDDDDGYDPTETNDVLDEKYHKVFHHLILSYLRTDATFLLATCYDLYKRSMPNAMKTLINEIEESFKVGEEEQSVFFTQAWADAFTVGDGSIFAEGGIFAEGRKTRPRQTLAIKDKCGGNIHVKKYLLHPNQKIHGWWLSRSKKNRKLSGGVRRTINSRVLNETHARVMSPLLLSFKKFNWMVIVKLSKWTRVFVDGLVPCNEGIEIAFKAQASILSWLNSLHGTTLPAPWYEEDFRKLAYDPDMPFLFDIALAGIIGSDGSVGMKKDRVFRIYQSNSAYCEELAKAMRTKYGVHPRVATRMSATLRVKPSTKIFFNVEDTEKLLLRVGSFDLNRPDQHVVLMLRTLVIVGNRNRRMENARKLSALLDNLSSYIKRVRPS
eukprot:scaffold391_cov88-Skeletonema_dohrnii-CCMP3373.AAC.6